MPLLSELVNNVGITDAEFEMVCPECATHQRLDEASVEPSENADTVYTCRNGHKRLLTVTTAGDIPWKGRGWRLGEWLIRNPSDILIHLPDHTTHVLLHAAPHALD